MAIRTKAEMLAGITSMFADNDEGDITAAIARSEFNDWIDSLLVPAWHRRRRWHHRSATTAMAS